MSLLSRLFGKGPDDREAVRPLWHNVVELARAKGWYASLGVEDSVAGRFDMVTLVLAVAVLRMEREEAMAEPVARLTELFVEDMDGQLRQSGIGDPTVGKHVRKLVTTLGGRLGALRTAIPGGVEALVPVLKRNITATADCDHEKLANAVIAISTKIGSIDEDAFLSADFSFEPI
ncbi:MAG: hypothetical protein KUG65_11990 [Sphingomonadaceae bacterium]|nr:hypothetical protein [Sphingomonadaceae bacterium]